MALRVENINVPAGWLPGPVQLPNAYPPYHIDTGSGLMMALALMLHLDKAKQWRAQLAEQHLRNQMEFAGVEARRGEETRALKLANDLAQGTSAKRMARENSDNDLAVAMNELMRAKMPTGQRARQIAEAEEGRLLSSIDTANTQARVSKKEAELKLASYPTEAQAGVIGQKQTERVLDSFDRAKLAQETHDLNNARFQQGQFLDVAAGLANHMRPAQRTAYARDLDRIVSEHRARLAGLMEQYPQIDAKTVGAISSPSKDANIINGLQAVAYRGVTPDINHLAESLIFSDELQRGGHPPPFNTDYLLASPTDMLKLRQDFDTKRKVDPAAFKAVNDRIVSFYPSPRGFIARRQTEVADRYLENAILDPNGTEGVAVDSLRNRMIGGLYDRAKDMPKSDPERQRLLGFAYQLDNMKPEEFSSGLRAGFAVAKGKLSLNPTSDLDTAIHNAGLSLDAGKILSETAGIGADVPGANIFLAHLADKLDHQRELAASGKPGSDDAKAFIDRIRTIFPNSDKLTGSVVQNPELFRKWEAEALATAPAAVAESKLIAEDIQEMQRQSEQIRAGRADPTAIFRYNLPSKVTSPSELKWTGSVSKPATREESKPVTIADMSFLSPTEQAHVDQIRKTAAEMEKAFPLPSFDIKSPPQDVSVIPPPPPMSLMSPTAPQESQNVPMQPTAQGGS